MEEKEKIFWQVDVKFLQEILEGLDFVSSSRTLNRKEDDRRSC